MTSVVSSPPEQQPTPPAPARRTGKWIDDWEPEDPAFWESSGKPVARRNLIWSIFAEHLGFSVWLLWSVSAAMLAKVGFAYTPQQLFWLVAVPNLVGSLLRLPYTFAVPKFGGRNFAVFSAALLMIRRCCSHLRAAPRHALLGVRRDRSDSRRRWRELRLLDGEHQLLLPDSPQGLSARPQRRRRQLGVSVIQFFLPIIVGAAGAFGLVKASQDGHPAARRLPLRGTRGRRGHHGVLLHGQLDLGLLQAPRDPGGREVQAHVDHVAPLRRRFYNVARRATA